MVCQSASTCRNRPLRMQLPCHSTTACDILTCLQPAAVHDNPQKQIKGVDITEYHGIMWNEWLKWSRHGKRSCHSQPKPGGREKATRDIEKLALFLRRVVPYAYK